MPEPIKPQPSTPTVLIVIALSLVLGAWFLGLDGPGTWDRRTDQAPRTKDQGPAPYAAATIAAMPWPPPMHAVASPYFLPRRRSSSRTVSSRRVPLMPSGWPSAIAPPLT